MGITFLLGAPERNLYFSFGAHKRLATGKAEGSGQHPKVGTPEGQRKLRAGWKKSTHPQRRVLNQLSWGYGHRANGYLDKVKKPEPKQPRVIRSKSQ